MTMIRPDDEGDNKIETQMKCERLLSWVNQAWQYRTENGLDSRNLPEIHDKMVWKKYFDV